MKILFFFVHPSKVRMFRYTINRLISEGHEVDVAIISKDVLEKMVQVEAWKYTNIFPEGRRSKSGGKLLSLFSFGLNFFKTITRLYRLTRNKKYDLFVTDDCLSIVGKIKSTPVLYYLDDDVSAVPESKILLTFATKIFSPACTNLGKFSNIKLPFKGYKELSYLHPKYFIPNSLIPEKYNLTVGKYVLIRLVSLTATHDIGKQGIDDNKLNLLIRQIEEKGFKVVISSERNLKSNYLPYTINYLAEELVHILAHARLFIGDSQTMSSEAAVLGVPGIRFNDFVGKISVMEEKEYKYGLYFGFKTNQFTDLLNKTNELLEDNEILEKWKIKKEKMLEDVEDVNISLYSAVLKFKP